MRNYLLAALLSLPSLLSALEHQTLLAAGKKVTVIQLDLSRDHLRLYHRDEQGKPLRRLEHLAAWLRGQGQTLLFGMNAGMYHGDFSAVGLYVSEGKELSPLNLKDGVGNFFMKPNGVFALTEKGACILPSMDYTALKGTVKLATQSGPLLLHRGKLHPQFMQGSKNRLIRNGVGILSPTKVCFAISEEPVNFHEFASFFRDALHCQDALFLDGTVSSLYLPALQRQDFRMELGPMLGVAVAATPSPK
jgi:uncharacterized protein YigE (DUF2233 family)